MGKLIVLSGSSGSGKTTICRRLMDRYPELAFSISATTRPRRKGEKEGADYYFYAKEKFQKMISEGEFIEWEEVHGNLYGTPKQQINEALKQNNALLLDVDPKGALHLKEISPDTLLIFLKAENTETLKKRLKVRKTESVEQIAKRMARIREEMPLAESFDYVLVNEDLDKTVEEVSSILKKEIFS